MGEDRTLEIIRCLQDQRDFDGIPQARLCY